MKKIFNAVIIPVFMLSLFFTNTPVSSACSYAYQTQEEKFAEADVVFLGKVVSSQTTITADEPSSTSSTETVFDVSEYWKGNIKKTTSIYSRHSISSTCYSFMGEVGSEYLVYANSNFETTEVGPVRASSATEAIEALGSGQTPALGITTPSPIPVPTPTPIPTPIPNLYSFTRNLSFGSRGEDVRNLQKYLNQNGFTVSLSGAGSLGNETTYFGPATRSALVKFQLANKISPPVGFFGPITRGVVNQ